MREQEVSFKIQATIDGQTEAGNKEAQRRIQEKNSTKKTQRQSIKPLGTNQEQGEHTRNRHRNNEQMKHRCTKKKGAKKTKTGRKSRVLLRSIT